MYLFNVFNTRCGASTRAARQLHDVLMSTNKRPSVNEFVLRVSYLRWKLFKYLSKYTKLVNKHGV